MKILLLVTGGRGGSDFFQGLLDGHSQILSFPMYLSIDSNFIQLLDCNDYSDLARKFIKLYPEFFNSKINKFERWNKLGGKKNKHFIVNEKKFIQSFINYSKKKKNINRLKILENLHYAYSFAKGEKVNKKKILFIHTHLLLWTKRFIKIMKLKNFEIIHTIRHPLASISSPLKTWLRFEDGNSFYPKDLHYQLDLVFNCINDLKRLSRVHIIQLEKLHLETSKVMRSFSRQFKIRYENCLNKSTKNGLKWWGDVFGQKWLSGINKNFRINIDERYFYKRDLIFFQNLTESIIKRYGYKMIYPKKNIYFNCIPMRCEILVWKNTIKHLRAKHILSIPYYYLKRIIFLNNLFVKNYKFPYSIGSERI